MPTPFKVKAVYDYRSEEPDDLIFDNGQIITVTEDDDADWYTGDYINAQGQKVEGIFPRNFVERYEPAIPTRPARAPRKAPLPEPVPVPEPEPEAPAEPAAAVTTPPETVVPAPERSKEPESQPPRDFSEPTPVPAPKPAAQPAPAPAPAPAAKKPPPVVEKPSSFRDRIAAFNKPAAAPVAPFKPSGSGGAGFIKKPFVAPPPSRNSYVPPPRDPPPAKAYRREEDVEKERAEPEPAAEHYPPVTSENTAEDVDPPKPTSLKDRIALLQQQQLEAAQRQAEGSKKKEKPKRPAKPVRIESSEAPIGDTEDDVHLERVSTDRSRRLPEVHADEPPLRRSIDDHAAAPTPPLPSRELVSDTNDADDSGAADTEDPHDISTEEEPPKLRSVKFPPVAAAKPEPAADEEVEEEDTEEDEDPELRRKRELRERMAKMSGGMGMMGMFGAGAPPPPPPKKSRSTREERHIEPSHDEEETQRAPPVPIMALPGMSNKSLTKLAPPPESDEEDETAQPTPLASQELEPAHDDYLSQRPSRRSTERSQPLSPHDRAPPPPPEDRPEPPQSPGARPVPPPPPPTRHDTQHSHFQSRDDSDKEDIEATSPAAAPKPPTTLPAAPSRAVPPPAPIRTDSSDDTPRTAPPVPMSPTLPQSRAPPPPPPGQAPPRRTLTQTSLQPPAREESEEEVTEYEGDYDTDIASGVKHKAALKSHQRDSSIEDSALSDDAVKPALSPQARTVPPPLPASIPRNVPPPPPHTLPRPRESVDSPRGAPPPIPPPQTASRPRESVDSPRAAPPPLPSTASPIEEDDYDPYRYSSGAQPGLPAMAAALRKPTEEFDDDYYEPSQTQPPPERAAPPPPPSERAVPPPPPAAAPPIYHEPDSTIMSGALSPPNRTAELGRSNTTSRRSTDVPRPGSGQGFIASDVDLAQSSMWWAQDNTPPPSLQKRNDVLWETEFSTTQKRGGRASVSRDVYVLYQDYSQTTVNATYDSSEPSHVSFEQTHERPPMPPRKDQLENAFETFGVQIAKGAEKAYGTTIGEGTAQDFVLSLIKPLRSALLPIGTRAYGALVYANLANASTQQFDEIRAGDIITFRGAKFAGHKGSLHQKYSQDVPQHVAIVIDWDGTKKKIRAWEQGNQEKGKKTKVREESYRVADLKSGEVRVWRVMPRSYVNWGTA